MSTFPPIPNYSTDPAETSFRHVLKHIQDPWIQSFLFPSDDVYYAQLQQALLQPQKITADMNITSLTPSADTLSLNELIRFLLLPSFTTGSVSVAYQINDYVSTNVTMHSAPYISRCVRDDEQAMLLCLAEIPGTPLTELSVCKQQSPGFREHVFMVVSTEPFRKAMRKLASDGDYDAELMRSSMVYTFQSTEIRDCPSCGRRSLACTCPLLLVRKRHPTDFDADLINLRSFLGSYYGISHQAIYEDGVNIYHDMSVTRASVSFSYDNDGRRKLESWALEHTLQGRNINLFKLNMPDVDMLQQPVIECTGDTVDSGVGPVDKGAIGEGSLSWSPFSDALNIPAIGQLDHFTSDQNANEILPQELPDMENIEDVITMRSQGSAQRPTTTTPALQDNVELEQSTECSQSAIPSPDDSSTAEQVGKPAQTCNEDEQPQAPELPRVAISSSTAPTQSIQQLVPQGRTPPFVFDNDAITRPKRMGRPPAPKPRPRTQVVQIAPAVNTATMAGVQKAMNISTEEARRKTELRKARNRASAVRSNERKKKQLQELKQSLAEAKQQEAAKRQEERDLRQVNLELRAKLSE